MRRRLSYANVMATLAFFFALTGGALAVNKYLIATDTIPATSDLAGSTYENPQIADGKVTNSKLAASARMWASVDGFGNVSAASKPDVSGEMTVPGEYIIDFGSGAPDTGPCTAVANARNTESPVIANADYFWAERAVVVDLWLNGVRYQSTFDVLVFC